MSKTDKEKKIKDLKDKRRKITSLKKRVAMLKIKMLEAKSKYNDRLPDLDAL